MTAEPELDPNENVTPQSPESELGSEGEGMKGEFLLGWSP